MGLEAANHNPHASFSFNSVYSGLCSAAKLHPPPPPPWQMGLEKKPCEVGILEERTAGAAIAVAVAILSFSAFAQIIHHA